MQRIRLIAFDIDGTLSPPGEPVPAAVIEALRACRAAGVLLVPATGRKFSSIASLCEQLGLDGPAVTCNGALTVRAATGEVTRSRPMPPGLYRRVVKTLRSDRRFSLAVFTPQDIVCEGPTFAGAALAAIGEPTTRLVEDLAALDGAAVAKVLAATPDATALRPAHADYAARFDGACSVTITSDTFLEFMAAGVCKGEALAEVARQAGIARDQIACIGDSDNDLSLFDAAGLRIAVANATRPLLEAADIIAPSAAKAGAAQALRGLLERA